MKVIYPNRIHSADTVHSGVTAAEENPNYLDNNVLDDHPKKVWKALTNNSEVTLYITGPSGATGCNALGLAGLSASSIAITVKDPDVVTIENKVSYDLKGINSYFKFFTDEYTAYKSYWIDYPIQSTSHFLVLEINNVPDSVAAAGVLIAGPSIIFYEPDFSLKEGLMDYSIVKELNNGSFYTRKRDVVRTFSGSFVTERDDKFYDFMRDIIKEEGSQPLFWRVTDYSNPSWAVYARCLAMPTGTHDNRDFSTINFSLKEVV